MIDLIKLLMWVGVTYAVLSVCLHAAMVIKAFKDIDKKNKKK